MTVFGDPYPWWGINPPWTVPPTNGYVCGGCGMWVQAGYSHSCRPFTAPLAPAGYTCFACGEFVIYGMMHACVSQGSDTWPTDQLLEALLPDPTPEQEILQLLTRVVELLEGQQSTGVQESSFETVPCDEDDLDTINDVDMTYTAEEALDDDEPWKAWNLNSEDYVFIGSEWFGPVHYASWDHDMVRYYFTSPAAAIRASRQENHPTFNDTVGLVMVKRLDLETEENWRYGSP